MTDLTKVIIQGGASIGVSQIKKILTTHDLAHVAGVVSALTARDAWRGQFSADEVASYMGTSIGTELIMGPVRRRFTNLTEGEIEHLTYAVMIWGLSYSARRAGMFPPGTLQSTAIDAAIAAGARYGVDQVME